MKRSRIMGRTLETMFAVLLMLCLGPVLAFADSDDTRPSLSRVWGNSANETSAKISSTAFESSEWVVIARDDDFADAMSATGLAGALDAPIVLTDRYGLSDAACDEIARLGATRAYVIGGRGAMPGDFEGELVALGFGSVERVWGNQSWDTSVECAKRIIEHGGNTRDSIVAMSLSFQDALSISSFAYKYQMPIYLQTQEGERPLPDEAVEMIEEAGGGIYVPGGPGAVRESTVEGVFGEGRVVRIYGWDGYDTSNQIATYMVERGLLSANTVTVACGAEAAKGSDALSGAALAGRAGGVILLANANERMEPARLSTIEDADSQGTAAFLSAYAGDVSQAYVLGGAYVMPEKVLKQIADLIGAGSLTIHFVDVGQGDCIFIELPDGKTALIDAGAEESGDAVVSYIRNLGYSKIDYILATHPHEDHIGGLPAVFYAFDVGEVWAPGAIHTTRTFEAFLDAVEAEGLAINVAEAGDIVFDSSGCAGAILSPIQSDYADLNDWSIVLSVKYDGKGFLFAGDAGSDVLDSTISGSYDVLKVGHHGSATSTTSNLIDRINPSLAVISCGTENSYGHPATSTLSALSDVDVYRTDLNGTIVVSLIAKSLSVTTAGPQSSEGDTPDQGTEFEPDPGSGMDEDSPESGDEGTVSSGYDEMVYIASSGNGTKYHSRPSCSNMKGADAITKIQAESWGYSPCKKCY